MSTTVSYKDETLTTVTNQTRTLETAGTYLEDDITLVDESATLTTKSISTNGTYNASTDDYDGYSTVTVSVPASAVDTGTKSISTNGTHDVVGYASASVSVPASAVDSGSKSIVTNGTHDVIGYASASVAVPNTYTSSDEGKVVQNGSLTAQTSDTFTSNNTYDTTTINSVTVAVPGSSPSLQTKSKTYTPTTSQQTETVQADNGYDGLEKVNITVNAMSTGTVTAPSSITGTSATVSTGTNTLTLSKTISVTPNVTTAGYISSGTAGNASVSLTGSVTTQAAQTIYPSTSDQTISSGRYLTGTQTIKAVTTSNLTADNIKSGVTITVGDSSDADRVASVTGTYSGGGGSSKNVQVAQSTNRVTATSLTAISGFSITVAETGTYDVYWSAFRSSTSGTWSTRLYIAGTASGDEQTTWTNHIQNVHLTDVSLTKNQTVQVYGKSRGTNYYLYGGTLTIIQQ